MAKSKFENLKSIVDYFGDYHVWTFPKVENVQSDLAVGILATIIRRHKVVILNVKLGDFVHQGDSLMKYGIHAIQAPITGVISAINETVLGRPLEGGDWIVRIKPSTIQI